MNITLEKLGAIIAIFVALSASIGNYFVMGEKINTLTAEVEILRSVDNQSAVAALTAEINNIKSAAMLAYQNMPGPYDDDWVRALTDQNMNRIIILETQMATIIEKLNRQIKELNKQIEELEDEWDMMQNPQMQKGG